MVSLDEGLLGKGQVGDVVERHREYGRHVESLDIIVFSRPGYERFVIAGNVAAYPTNSGSLAVTVAAAARLGGSLCRRQPFDLIVTQDPIFTGLVGLWLRSRHGGKLLVHLHGDFVSNPQWYRGGIRSFVRARLVRLATRRADAIRVVSEGQRAKLRALGIPGERIRVIATPVDLDKFIEYRADGRRDASGPDDHVGKTVLMVARRDPVKDFDTLFAAMETIISERDDTRLWLVGSLGDHAEVPLPPSKVRLSPRMESDDMPACYAAADVIVLTSRSEGFGKVLVEANACGKPVVATDTVGARYLVEDDFNGFIVPVGDSDEIARKVLYLLERPDRARQMGENGRARMKERFADGVGRVVGYWRDIVDGATG